MRSKTAEFERIVTNQQQQQLQQHTKSIAKSHSQNIQSHGSGRSADAKIATSLKTSDSSSNVRNGPIYKRRDVISSALNIKKWPVDVTPYKHSQTHKSQVEN